jgi:hypothetical protein
MAWLKNRTLKRIVCRQLCSGWRPLLLAVALGMALSAGSCRTRGVYPPATAVGVGRVTPAAIVGETPRPGGGATWHRRQLTAEAVGVAPAHATNRAQRRQLARRFAITEARRQLAAQLGTVQVNAEVQLNDLMSSSDQVRAACRELVLGAEVVQEVFTPNGECQVTVGVVLQSLRQVVEEAVEPQRERPGEKPKETDEDPQAQALQKATIDAQQKLVAAIYREYVDRQLTNDRFKLVVQRINEQGALRGAEIQERSYNPRTGEARVRVRMNDLQVASLVELMRSMR